MHGDQEGIGAGGADVVALQGDGGGEDDVGVAGRWGPEGVVDDDRVGAGEGAAEAGEVLVVVEGVASAPSRRA